MSSGSGKPKSPPKSPEKKKGVLEIQVKGFYSPTKQKDGWSKVSMSQPEKKTPGSPPMSPGGGKSPKSSKKRTSGNNKHGIPTVNLNSNNDSIDPNDVEALRRVNAQRMEEVERRKLEREQAAAKRKSERASMQRPHGGTAGVEGGSDEHQSPRSPQGRKKKDYDESSSDDEPPPRRPVSFSPRSSPAQQQKRSVAASHQLPTKEMSNASLYSPLKKKNYVNAEQCGMYSPTTGNWKKVAPKFDPDAPPE